MAITAAGPEPSARRAQKVSGSMPAVTSAACTTSSVTGVRQTQ